MHFREYLLELVSPNYHEPHRHYHTIRHIYQMYDEYDEASHFIEDSYKMFPITEGLIIEIAIAYHDVFYQAKAVTGVNEDQSINKMYRDLTNIFSSKILKASEEMIKLTKHHIHTVGDIITECFFLDFDLSILGKPERTYVKYEEEIRKEYIHRSNEEWIKGRSEFLQQLLSRKSIFHTQYFRDIYEEEARKNIQRSINQFKEV